MAYALILSGLMLVGALIALCLALYTQQNEIDRLETELKKAIKDIENEMKEGE